MPSATLKRISYCEDRYDGDELPIRNLDAALEEFPSPIDAAALTTHNQADPFCECRSCIARSTGVPIEQIEAMDDLLTGPHGYEFATRIRAAWKGGRW